MIEMLTPIDTGWCKHCRNKITKYQGDLTIDPRWSHDENGKESCPGTPVATPAAFVVDTLPPPGHARCPLPPVEEYAAEAVWRCPVCTTPWVSWGTGWDVADFVYIGPRQPVRDEPQA